MSSNEKAGVKSHDEEWHNSLSKLAADFNALLKGQEANSNEKAGHGHDPVQKLQQLTEVVKEGVKNGKLVDGQLIVDDIYNMTDHANSLATSFANAHALLVKIDGHNYKRADGTVVKYADKWDGYHGVSIIGDVSETPR
jgi:hypothetical protein